MSTCCSGRCQVDGTVPVSFRAYMFYWHVSVHHPREALICNCFVFQCSCFRFLCFGRFLLSLKQSQCLCVYILWVFLCFYCTAQCSAFVVQSSQGDHLSGVVCYCVHVTRVEYISTQYESFYTVFQKSWYTKLISIINGFS